MKINASSLHQHGGLNGALVHVRLVPKITYGGSNLQLSMFKLHKRGPQLFFFYFYGNEIHTSATVKGQIEDKLFKILYIISHNICNNRGTALSTSKIYTYLKK